MERTSSSFWVSQESNRHWGKVTRAGEEILRISRVKNEQRRTESGAGTESPKDAEEWAKSPLHDRNHKSLHNNKSNCSEDGTILFSSLYTQQIFYFFIALFILINIIFHLFALYS